MTDRAGFMIIWTFHVFRNPNGHKPGTKMTGTREKSRTLAPAWE
jgi:hypothetical protein